MHTYRNHTSGLVLAEQSQDQRTVQQHLARLDDRLILWPPDATSRYWRVMRRVADDRPAMPVLTWMGDDGQPLPLSSGLVDAVQKLRLDSRHQQATADELNARHVEAVAKEREQSVDAIHEEYSRYLERGRKGVTLAQVGKRRYWQRDNGVHR